MTHFVISEFRLPGPVVRLTDVMACRRLHCHT